jgi:hypothetical protein
MKRVAFAIGAVIALAALSRGEAQTPAGPPSPAVGTPAARETATLRLDALFAGGSKPIQSGLVWRIYQDGSDGMQPPLVKKEASPAPILSLPPGPYIIHATYGFASASRRVNVRSGNNAEQLTISAGGLRLGGVIADQPIPKNRLSYSIFVPIGSNSEGRLVAANVKAGELVVLPEGTYHVASTYGESNAIMRADLKVEPGKVTDATLNHRAATLILKLVSADGGEAFAGTAFSVLTPGGDVIREAIGAFPSVTLAEGDYVLIARHEGRVYQREFKVESGLDRDVEVLAKP